MPPAPVITAIPPPRAPWPFVRDQLARGYVAPVIGLGVIIALHALADSAVPLVLGALVDGIVAGDAPAETSWRSPWALFAALAGLWIAGPQIARLYQLVHPRVFIPLRTRIYDELFAHVLGQSPRFFMDEPSGTLSQKIRNVGNAVFMLVETVCSSFVRIVTLLLVAAGLIARAAPELLVALAAFVALFVAVSAAFSRRCRPFAVEAARSGSVFAGRLADSLSNWDAVLSFARAGFERALIGPFARAEQDAIIRWRAELVKMRVLLNLLSLAFLIALAAGALRQTLGGELAVGGFVAIVTVGVLIAGYMVNLGDSILMMQEWYGQLVDGLATVALPHEIADAPEAQPLRVTRGAIELRDVTFSYPDGTPVFAGLSLSIAPGERIGLVGPSGAGKSTLIRLIRRQFDIQGGAILIDGQDIARATRESLHDAIAEVPQSPGMFHRTVRENIAYGRLDAGEDAIREAARLAHCHEFIAARAHGYDAVVGEKGMKLSGGERQRVAIARAFLKNAPILILDEATSSLDSDAEHLIQDALLTLMKGRTVIAIAHRLSTIMSMDRIVVLDGGRIAEQGTHADLLAARGIYARLWARQAGGFI